MPELGDPYVFFPGTLRLLTISQDELQPEKWTITMVYDPQYDSEDRGEV